MGNMEPSTSVHAYVAAGLPEEIVRVETEDSIALEFADAPFGDDWSGIDEGWRRHRLSRGRRLDTVCDKGDGPMNSNLEECVICHGRVSVNAPSCPHCGQPRITKSEDDGRSLALKEEMKEILRKGPHCGIFFRPWNTTPMDDDLEAAEAVKAEWFDVAFVWGRELLAWYDRVSMYGLQSGDVVPSFASISDDGEPTLNFSELCEDKDLQKRLASIYVPKEKRETKRLGDLEIALVAALEFLVMGRDWRRDMPDYDD
jgi:hypothetical protein